MEDHTEDVPDEWWDDIRDELFSEDDKNKGVVFTTDNHEPEKKEEKASGYTIKPLLYRIAAVAAAIAFLLIIGKRLFDMANEELLQKETYSQDKTVNRKLSNDQIVSTENKSTTEDRSEKNNDGYAVLPQASQKNIFENILDKIMNESNKDEELKINTQGSTENAEILKQNTTIAQEQNTTPESQKVEEVQDEPSKLEESVVKEKSKLAKHQSKKSWMLNLLTGSTSSGSAQQFPGYATMSGSPMSVDEVFHISDFHENPLTQILLANQDEEVKAKIRHKIPVTLGVSLYYNVGKKWGIGTGVNYTKLSSELRSGSSSNLIKSDQSVHYIGIPVQVNYNAVQKGRFTGYITGGALVEKAVAGNVKTKYIVNDEVKEEKTENLESKPTQFSVNGGLGFQYKIINNIGIYAEPGVSYHFKDNSSLNTIYKEKPLNFNMKFGIRVLIDN